MGELISRTEAAKLLGISASALDNHRGKGRIDTSAYGKYDRDDVMRLHGELDPVRREIDRAGQAVSKAAREEISGKPKATPPKAAPPPKAEAKPAKSKAPADPAPSHLRSIEGGKSDVLPSDSGKPEQLSQLGKARMTSEFYRAKEQEYKFKKLAGQLVDRDTVKHDVASLMKMLVQRLRSLPPRLGPMLASVSDPTECMTTVDKEIRILIEELQDGLAKI